MDYWRQLIEKAAVTLRTNKRVESAEILENAEYSIKFGAFTLDGSGFYFVSIDFLVNSELYAMVKLDQDKYCRGILSTLVLFHTDGRNVKIISANIIKKG